MEHTGLSLAISMDVFLNTPLKLGLNGKGECVKVKRYNSRTQSRDLTPEACQSYANGKLAYIYDDAIVFECFPK